MTSRDDVIREQMAADVSLEIMALLTERLPGIKENDLRAVATASGHLANALGAVLAGIAISRGEAGYEQALAHCIGLVRKGTQGTLDETARLVQGGAPSPVHDPSKMN